MKTHFSVLVSIVATCLASSVACVSQSDDELLNPRAEVIDQSTQALTAAELLWINGTYGTGCKDPAAGTAHLATDAWSLRISGVATMTNDALAVTKGDSDCTLTLTAISTSGGVRTASSSFALGAAYAGSARSFGSGAAKFFANAKINPADMSASPTVTVLFSDDLSAVDGGTKTGTYAQFAGTSGGTTVPAPNYEVSSNSIAVEANEDATVSATTGSFALTTGSVAGNTYRVILGELVSPTYESVDTAYNAVSGDPAAVTISGAVSIASANILANDVPLPAKRTVIFRKVVDGVASYQIFSLSFSAPS